MGELGAESLECLGIELPQCVAEAVDVSLAVPDEALMRPREQLDCVGELAVPCYRAVVVAVRAHDVGQDLGVTGV